MGLPLLNTAQAASGRFFDGRSKIAQEVLTNRTDRRILVDGPLGTGKAQPLDAIVWSPTGPRRMYELVPGDTVLTPTGEAVVTGIYPQGEQPVYKVTFTTGEVVECTGDHLWAVNFISHPSGLPRSQTWRLNLVAKLLSAGAMMWVPEVSESVYRAAGLEYPGPNHRRYIEKIEPAGTKPCQCIRIDSSESLYLTDGFIPTHNTRLNLEKVRGCCLKYPGCRWVLLRSVRKWLTQSALVTWEENVLMPGDIKKDRIRREGRTEYRFKNGSVCVVAGLDDPQAVFSAEYDGACLIEAVEVSKEVADAVDGRLRYGKMPYQQFLMDCNPRAPTHWLHVAFESGWCRRYPMRHTDNPAFYMPDGVTRTRKGVAYLSRLDDLTGVSRARNRDGKWVQAEGAIYDNWDAAIHVVDRFPIPSTWTRYQCIDFGFTNPLSWQWWAEDDDGGLWMYREIYQTGRLVSDVAAWAKHLTEGEPRPRAAVGDHDPEAIEQVYKHGGLRVIPADKGDRKGGIQQVKERLNSVKDGKPRKPRLHVFRDALCHEPDEGLRAAGKPTNLAAEMDAYVWNPNLARGEEPLKVGDHAVDACRYLMRHIDNKPRGDAVYGADYEAAKNTGLPEGTFGARGRQSRESDPGELPAGTFG